jgi:hypothetical protein
MKISELFAYIFIGVVLIATCLVSQQRAAESESLLEIIRAEVKAEMDRRYRNVPHIQVEKVYTLQAMGKDLMFDVESK